MLDARLSAVDTAYNAPRHTCSSKDAGQSGGELKRVKARETTHNGPVGEKSAKG